jgi:hypothetical protein
MLSGVRQNSHRIKNSGTYLQVGQCNYGTIQAGVARGPHTHAMFESEVTTE